MSLVEFEEWFEGNESKFEYPRLAHKSAKQAWNYQQGEVDKLQTEIDEITKQRDSFIKAHHIYMNDVCEYKDKIDKLQARVDEVMKYIEPSDELSHKAYRDLVKILKGNKDEN